METITHRQMRNDSGDILRRAAAGESFLVTNDGVPAAEISPPSTTTVQRAAARGQLTAPADPSSVLAPLHTVAADLDAVWADLRAEE